MRSGLPVVAILLALSSQAFATACTKFNAPMSLRGVVVSTLFYGPPNFGEDPKHDSRNYYPVLVLDRPLELCELSDGNFTAESKTVKQTEMILAHDPYQHAWEGKHVIVRGELFPRETASHHTPVMLDARNVRVVGQ